MSKEKILSYYRKKESRWGYKLMLQGFRHLGYHEQGDESYQEATYKMVDYVADKAHIKAGSVVLDAGCGEGGSSIYLAKNRQTISYGVDLLPESIEIAKT